MRTAIEVLVQDLEKLGVHLFDEVQEAIEQAKEMHKQEMIQFTQNYVFECVTCSYDGAPNPLKEAEKYYNETFKSE